jgi:serine/threonine protein kinase
VVLELMEGNLNEYFDSSDYNIKESNQLCEDVIKGLRHLHWQDILHRDLTPGNILYKTHPKLCLRIADFGLSRHIGSTSIPTVHSTNAGTRCWIAPEVITCKAGTNVYTKSSDIFVCGVVLHYILSKRKHPFAPNDCAEKSELEINNKTEANVIDGKIVGWDDSLCPESTHLVTKMLDSDESKRPTAAEALAHPLFWTKKKKNDFLIAVGNQKPEFKPRATRSPPLSAVEMDLETGFGTIVKFPKWDDPRYPHMPFIYSGITRNGSRYDTSSLVELVRFIRNAYAHVTEIISKPDLLLKDYVFLEYFPNLVIEVYKAVTTHRWDQTREEIKRAINQ